MRVWRYARSFRTGGHDVRVITDVGTQTMATRVEVDGAPVANDRLDMSTTAYRLNRLLVPLPGGRVLAVEAGYNSWWNVGMRASLDGATVWESHPGRDIALPTAAARLFAGQSGADGQMARMKAQRPALIVDIGLALLFFAVAKMTDLRTAALVAAGAGLLLVVAQRFVKVDLLGGLAMFGILMTLLGAGFAILFEDETMIQLRSTVLGGIAAGLFLTDGLFGGRYLGRRMMLYVPVQNLDPRRLVIGLGLGGIVLAGLNWLVVALFTKDQWLVYTTFLDTPIALASVVGAIRLARINQPADQAKGPGLTAP
jgi:intracellular septation protein A